jgi:spore germination protein YaaH
MSKIFFSIFVFLLLIFTILFAINLFYETPLSSSINQDSRLHYLKELIIPKKPQKIVYGFLPYWNIDQVKIEKELTHLAYFGLDIASDGAIISKDQDGNLDPGYRELQGEKFLDLISQIQIQKGKIELVLKQFDNDTISNFLNNQPAQDNFLKSVDSILLAYPITGINLDIEYSGENSQTLRPNLVQFVKKLNAHLDQKYNNINLSIDVYASAASNPQSLWDLNALKTEVDYIIVMAYDFHQRSSTQAGPVAPLFSENGQWNKDINQHLKIFFEQVPREKILLGIPFYGYCWRTDSKQAKANTYENTGFTVSYKKTKELLAMAEGKTSQEPTWQGAHQIKKSFDENALSPYLTYEQDNELYTIYYEDATSLTYKLEYARQLDLAGIAIWALGYEDEERELWQAIADGI